MPNFFNEYTTAGPGIDKDAPPKSRIYHFFEIYFRKFWKLILLNFLYILYCLPVVTIGAATGGFVYILRKFAEENPVFLFSDFRDAVKRNWKQSTIMTLINLLSIFVLTYAIFFYYENIELSVISYLGLGFCVSVLILFIMANFYTYLMIVSTNLKLKQIIKNAVILVFAGGKTNILTAFFGILFIVPIALLFPFSIIFILIFGFSTLGFIIVFNSYRHILNFVINPFYEQNGENKNKSEKTEDVIFKDIGTKEIPVKIPKKSSFGKGKGKKIT